MKMNVGTVDRLVRLVAGMLILGLGAYYRSPWALVGFVPLLTAFAGFCPAYKIFHISTCSKKECASGAGECGCGSSAKQK